MAELILLLVVLAVIIFIILTHSKNKIDLRLYRLESKAKAQESEIQRLKSQINELANRSTSVVATPQVENVPAVQPATSETAEQFTNLEMSSVEAVETLLATDTTETTDLATTTELQETHAAPSYDPFIDKVQDVRQPNPILQWFLKGNPILKVGAVILFLGLSFLLRFASEHISFSIEARYASVAITGVICSLVGWRLRNTRREYGLTLQGLGIGVLYLTSLATFKLHQLFPVWLVFLFQVILVAVMVALALLQNARILAQVALIGGLASPVLLSDGSGNYLVLFSYLALLNTSIAVVAWFKSWRSLDFSK